MNGGTLTTRTPSAISAATRRAYAVHGAKALLIALGLWLTNHQVGARMAEFVRMELYFALVVFVGIWLCALLALFYVAWRPASKTRAVWIAVIAFSTLIGDLFFRITGEHFTIRAVEAICYSIVFYLFSSDLTGVAGFYVYYALMSALATAVLCLGLLLRAPFPAKLDRKLLAVVPFVPLLLLAGLVIYGGGDDGRETSSMPQQFLPASVLALFLSTPTGTPPKADVEIPRSSSALARNVVVVVDESVRGDFIDLPGDRDITPYLASISSQIIDFGWATSAHNCSDSSNAILRLGTNPRTIGQQSSNPLGNPSIWKYADRAGFDTTYLDGYGNIATRLTFFSDEEVELIHHYVTFPDSDPTYEVDYDLAKRLIEVLNQDTPQFVLVNKRGVHFPYRGSYPETQTVFQPVIDLGKKLTDKGALENTYKNAIRWSVDGFFRELLPRLDLSETILIYTSDHGQNLLDDGKPVTHCRQSPNLYEALVPLLVFTSAPELAQRFQEAARRNHHRASQFQVFPTVLVLMGYAREQVEKKYFDDLFTYQATPLGFTSGPITGRFGRRPRWHPSVRTGLQESRGREERLPGHIDIKTSYDYALMHENHFVLGR